MRELQLFWTREPEVQPTDDTGRTMTALYGQLPDHQVCFYEFAEMDHSASTPERPRFKDRTFIAMMPCGKDDVVKDYATRPLREGDELRYPRAWASFQARIAHGRTLALELIPGIRPHQIMELEALKLPTMEALALSDVDIDDLEPLRAAARRFIKPRFRLIEGQMVAA